MEFGLVPIPLPSVCGYKHKGYWSGLPREAGLRSEPAGAGTGTKLVGGTTPGKGGKTHLGLPALNPVKEGGTDPPAGHGAGEAQNPVPGKDQADPAQPPRRHQGRM